LLLHERHVEAAEMEVYLHSPVNYMVNERAGHSLLFRIKLSFLLMVSSAHFVYKKGKYTTLSL
jgi:hypothetical protein